VPLVGLSLFLGIYPKPVIDRVEPAVRGILCHVQENSDYEEPPVAFGGRVYATTEGTDQQGRIAAD
jgi:NADH-quinone oxidoreductase subunit M